MEPSFQEQIEFETPASRDEPGGWLNIYTLPPLAAALISLILTALMLKFAFRQVSELELGAPPLAGIENQVSGEVPDPRRDQGPIASLFTPEVQYWGSRIGGWAQEWNLDPNLVATVMQIESCGHPTVVSSAGASGLFQVMPFHFKAGENHTQPDTNALRGLSYLSRSLESHGGDVYLALAGYNGGIGMSQRDESRWPAETRRYTYWGSGIYRDAAARQGHSARLEEWLGSGGASLCRRAAAALGLDQ